MNFWVVTVDGKVSGPFAVQARAWVERTAMIRMGVDERDITVVRAENAKEARKQKPQDRFQGPAR